MNLAICVYGLMGPYLGVHYLSSRLYDYVVPYDAPDYPGPSPYLHMPRYDRVLYHNPLPYIRPVHHCAPNYPGIVLDYGEVIHCGVLQVDVVPYLTVPPHEDTPLNLEPAPLVLIDYDVPSPYGVWASPLDEDPLALVDPLGHNVPLLQRGEQGLHGVQVPLWRPDVEPEGLGDVAVHRVTLGDEVGYYVLPKVHPTLLPHHAHLLTSEHVPYLGGEDVYPGVYQVGGSLSFLGFLHEPLDPHVIPQLSYTELPHVVPLPEDYGHECPPLQVVVH